MYFKALKMNPEIALADAAGDDRVGGANAKSLLGARKSHNLPISKSTIRINRINPNPPLG